MGFKDDMVQKGIWDVLQDSNALTNQLGWSQINNSIENSKRDATEQLRTPRTSESLMVNVMSGVPESQDVAPEMNLGDLGWSRTFPILQVLLCSILLVRMCYFQMN